MTQQTTAALQQEWCLLQNQYDSYEKMALVVKLSHLVLVSLVLSWHAPTLTLVFFSGLFWLTDAIWKTFQFRIEDRLLKLENALRPTDLVVEDTAENDPLSESQITNDTQPFQFNSEFLITRPSTLGLILNYVKNALRPTVALPHVAVMFWYIVLWFCS